MFSMLEVAAEQKQKSGRNSYYINTRLTTLLMEYSVDAQR